MAPYLLPSTNVFTLCNFHLHSEMWHGYTSNMFHVFEIPKCANENFSYEQRAGCQQKLAVTE